MWRPTKRAIAAALAAAVCGGCEAEDVTPPIDAAFTGDPQIDGPDGPPMVQLSGVTFSFDPDRSLDEQPRLVGVEVCAVSLDPPRCVTSGGAGWWTLALPPDDPDLRLTFTAGGHLAIQLVGATSSDDSGGVRIYLAPDAVAGALYDAIGAVYPEPGAAVILRGHRPADREAGVPLEGATVTADAGLGPSYWSGLYQHGADQQATSAAGLGHAAFVNVPPGPGALDVTVALDGATCGSAGGLVDGPAPGSVQVPLREGYATLVDVVCGE